MRFNLKFLVTSAISCALVVASPLQANDMPYGLKSGKPYDGVTLNVLSVVTPQFQGLALRDEEFTELTGIDINWTNIPFGSLQEKVSSVGIAANGNFDVVNYLDSWGNSNADWFVSLDKLLERDGISMDRYPPAFAKSATFGGEVKGLPLRAHAQLMFYRKDIFSALRIQPPTSWDDVRKASRIIKEKYNDIDPLALYYGADGNRQNLFIWLNFLWGAGGELFTKDFKPAWTTPEAIKATREYIDLHTKEQHTAKFSVSWVEQEARTAFAQGKVAMVPVWWWAYSGFTNPKSSKLDKEKVGFVGMPAYGDNKFPVTYAISMPFSISKYSKKQQAAWEFMKWLSNPALEKKNAIERKVKGQAIVNNVVTHSKNLVDGEVNGANDFIGIQAYFSLRKSNIMPQLNEWPQIGDLLSQAIASAAAGGDVEELMKDAAKKSERVLKRAGYYK